VSTDPAKPKMAGVMAEDSQNCATSASEPALAGVETQLFTWQATPAALSWLHSALAAAASPGTACSR